MTKMPLTLRRVAAATALLLAMLLAPATRARAADAVFPAGVRVGLVPLEGLTASPQFSGFISSDQKVRVGLSEIPEAAFTAVETAVKNNSTPAGSPKPQVFPTTARQGYLLTETGKDGDDEVSNYTLLLPGNKFTGYVIVQVRGDAGDAYSEANIRKMLASAVTRAEIPVEEQLAQLGFKLGDLAGFKHVRTIAPRSAVLLSDGDDDARLDSLRLHHGRDHAGRPHPAGGSRPLRARSRRQHRGPARCEDDQQRAAADRQHGGLRNPP